jgi:hypothetical protein
LILSRTSKALQPCEWNLEQSLVSVTVIAVQAAADAAPSAMVSVIGLDSDKVAALCDAANEEVSEDERVQIANFLCPVSWPIYLFCCFPLPLVLLKVSSTYMSRYAYGPSL